MTSRCEPKMANVKTGKKDEDLTLLDTSAMLTVRGKNALKAREKRTTKPEPESLRKVPSTAKRHRHQDR